MVESVRVGVVGCGNISQAYFEGMARFPLLRVLACADLDMSRAEACARRWGVAALSCERLLEHPEIDIVVNLTVPSAHVEVSRAALRRAKHVYSEKPLAASLEEGLGLVALAKERGVRLGVAPDTFLGGGLQTCRKCIDDGWVGEPIAVTACMMSAGWESWHPHPHFYYQVGGGPMFDMGPYYLTALVSLIGPIRRVTGTARITFAERVIASEPHRGERIEVETPTHVAGVIDFANGAIGTLVTSFDIMGGTSDLPSIEIYGSEGTLRVPDPNQFGGPVRLRRAGVNEWQELSLTHGFVEQSRGLGVADMAYAIRSGRPHRASGELAAHVLEAMQGFHVASAQSRHHVLVSRCQRPAALPTGLPADALDA
jgi:predicted dehydrogenase